MTLLVTGAMGHVGYEIVRQATQRGLQVIALYRGTFDAARAGAVGAGVRWLQCDLADTQAVRALADAHRVDARFMPRPSPTRPMHGRRRCWPLPATSAPPPTCWRARAPSRRRFLLVSTGSVFQLRADTRSPILEDEATAPANVYTTKVCAEQLTRMYRTEYGLSASIVRISWVYGPPVISDQPTRGPIPSYLLRALRAEAIREGGADFAASFTFVGDVAEGLVRLATSPGASGIVNLGSGNPRRVAAYRRSAEGRCPVRSSSLGQAPSHGHATPAFVGRWRATRFLSDTGYAPTHSLDTGVRAYADWMRANPAAWGGRRRLGPGSALARVPG
jgi:nucleoside-diphosphate-sugar epimerase